LDTPLSSLAVEITSESTASVEAAEPDDEAVSDDDFGSSGNLVDDLDRKKRRRLTQEEQQVRGIEIDLGPML
jgi:hypothetical protein